MFTGLTPHPYGDVLRRGWRRRRGAVYDAFAMRAALVVASLTLFVAVAPAAAEESLFLSILPPGQDGLVPAGNPGAPRPHAIDQVAMYADLILTAPGLHTGDLRRFFKDAGIDVPSVIERIEHPRSGVTISRDVFDVPHVVGETRGDVFFGAGYATGEDRLFLTDIFRHVGRGRLSELDMDRGIYAFAGYSEDELQAQVDAFPSEFPAFGTDVMNDITEFTAGMNAYIAEARSDPARRPLEYDALHIPIEDWQVRDVVAIAVLFTQVFGAGGGGEHANVILRQALEAKLGNATGDALWQDLREADDPEAPVTTSRRFAFPRRRDVDPAAIAIPDPGSIAGGGPIAVRDRVLAALGMPSAMSNWIAVTANRAEGKHPIAVMGPQTGYRSPEVLIELSLQGGGVNARGATFPGLPYVTLGHTQRYAWSATSGGSDQVDVRVERLCDPSGGTPGTGTLLDGVCRPMSRRVDTWTAVGKTITATVERTPHGNVFAHATVGGVPVVLSAERTTLFREIASTPAFVLLNTEQAHGPRAFRTAMSFVNQSFNWLYVDERDVAYFHSGDYPVRAAGVDPDLPSWGTGEWEWEGLLPAERHPFDVNPSRGWIASWNNKPARSWRAADANFSFGPVYRVLALSTRLARAVSGGLVDPAGVVDVMADAATVDLRGQVLLPDALALARQDPSLAHVTALLEAWNTNGAHRRDRDADGRYDDDTKVALMDAWYPRLVHAAFDGQLADVYGLIPLGLDDKPGHLGSAYQSGYYGHLLKALRQARGAPVRGRYRVLRCADGTEAGCAAAVQSSLHDAMAELTARFGSSSPTDWHADPAGDFIQYDLGGFATAPSMPWQNRPTFQQVVQVH
jgi:acyl-homoserine lactone acylase PvdQ